MDAIGWTSIFVQGHVDMHHTKIILTQWKHKGLFMNDPKFDTKIKGQGIRAKTQSPGS